MTTPLIHLADLNPSSPRFDALDADADVSFTPMEAVTHEGLRPVLRAKREVATGYTRFEDGDVLVPKIAPTFGHGRVVVARGLRGGVGAGTTELHVLRPRPGTDVDWLRYCLLTHNFLAEGEATYYGVAGQKRIDSRWLRSYPLPTHSLARQRRVAHWLDSKCSDIESAIAECDQLAGLVQQRAWARRAELATQGAAAGRTPAGSDSGLWWVGIVPSHWTVVPLKHVASLQSGHTPSRSRPELWEDCTLPWISLNDVGALESAEEITTTLNKISEAGLAASSARILPKGTVVLSRDATVGRSAIMGMDMATSQHFADWVCSADLNPRYLLLLFRTVMQPYFESLTAGSTLKTIGMPELRGFRIPLPPLEEQAQIAALASEVEREADRLVAELTQQRRLLVEHKQALITAAVTGQLEVA